METEIRERTIFLKYICLYNIIHLCKRRNMIKIGNDCSRISVRVFFFMCLFFKTL